MLRFIRELFPLHGFSAGVTVILSQIIASYLVNTLSFQNKEMGKGWKNLSGYIPHKAVEGIYTVRWGF